VTYDRKRITRLLAGLGATALVASMTAASPSSADPKVTDVQARVNALYRQAEVAAERLNQARDDLARGQTRLRALQADVDRKHKQVELVRRQVVAAVVSQSQGQGLSPATQAAFADGPDGFLQRLVIMSQYDDQQHQKEAAFAIQERQLELRQQAATRELRKLASTKHELAAQKAKIEAKAAEAKGLLNRLKAQSAARAAERLAQASRSLDRTTPTPSPAPAPTPAPSASGRAGAAVSYALSHVGDSYVWGATGPSAFDCSGLTMMAWQQAGVSLPHSSSAQMSSGTPVSQSELQPGDLVFYYSPVSHVGIYIGNGKIVNAENPSVGVVEAPVNSMPYSGAVRPG
jgi:cell wall-associated NlpC family hydrolase